MTDIRIDYEFGASTRWFNTHIMSVAYDNFVTITLRLLKLDQVSVSVWAW